MRINTDKARAATERWFQQQEEEALAETQKLTLEIYKRAKEGSPVDTGEFLGKWEVFVPAKLGQPGRILNSAPHAQKMADGGSPQAQRGWLGLIVRAVAKWRGRA